MNKKQPITIADKTYQIGFSFRAIKLFEEMTGKSIQDVTNSWDNLVYAYCSLKALNPEFTTTLDEFVDILDADPQLLIDLSFGTQQEPQAPSPAPDAIKKKFLTLKTFFMLWMLSILLLVAPVLIPFIFGSAWILRNLKVLALLIAKRGNKPA